MVEPTSLAGRVLEAVVASGLMSAEQLGHVRETTSNDGQAGQVMLTRGLMTQFQLNKVLEEELGTPRVDLASYTPDEAALALVPTEAARSRNILPLFEIEGILTVAVADPGDVFSLDDLAAEIGVEIEIVLSDEPTVTAAIEQYYGEVSSEPQAESEPGREPEPSSDVAELEPDMSSEDFFALGEEVEPGTEAVGEPAGAAEAENLSQTIEEVVEGDRGEPESIDLDVLAVAGERKVTLLVAEILERAVARGADRIHLLPYKADFFLVFRVGGRLENVSSAPLSMQGPLVEGFKNVAKLGLVPADAPALGRVHAEIGGKQLVLTVSSVPTVAGQRLVVSISPARPSPRSLTQLGVSDAERLALEAMVERGRGMLLIAAPVAGGRSSTYYALLSHAAEAGRTVYSVERAIEYELEDVAQVLVNPGSVVGAASYFAAGMRQDTDVLAIDAMQSVEDVHLAIEGAGIGKLVIATFAGSDIVSAVRRMLDLGAEPVSLASALTLAVGQRVVRTNCPNCSVEERVPLSDDIPGAKLGMPTRRGTGCPNCGKTGFGPPTGIFEVLPVNELVRAQIARGASAEQLEAAAREAGMRPLVASGLEKVLEGTLSPEELDRVLRFSVSRTR